MGTGAPSGIYFMNQASAGTGELSSFPRQFRRNLASRIDPRFLTIFGILFLIAFFTVGLLSQRKVNEVVSDKEITKIQERYAQLVLNQPKPKPPEVKKEEKVKENVQKTKEVEGEQKEEEVKVDREKETFVQRQKRQEATKEQRQVVREKVKAAIASTGIFAAITSTGGSGGSSSSSSGVTDLLGAANEGVSDLGNIKVSKGTFATKNVDVADLKAKRGSVTSGVDIAHESVGKAKAERISSGGGVAISSSAPEVSGNTTNAEARTQTSIKKVIDLESNRLKRVYETWLKRDPSLAGQLKIKFTIMPDGSVTNVTVVSSTTKNSDFDETLVRYIKRWAFPAVDGASPVEVVFPFVFEAQT
jgi:periplasmic protein TonB